MVISPLRLTSAITIFRSPSAIRQRDGTSRRPNSRVKV
jgi:hypothetical protein